MIIECPECQAEFTVPSTVFAKGGRKLKCASCKHVWFHDPATVTKSAEASNPALDAIADKLDQAGGSSSSSARKGGGFLSTLKTDLTEGKIWVGLGLLLILCGFILYYVMQPSLIMGQGLAFDHVRVERQENGSFLVTGDIINTMNAPRGVPDIAVHIAGDHAETRFFQPAQTVLESNQSFDFSYTINDLPDDADSITVTFAGNHSSDNKTDEPDTLPDSQHHDEGHDNVHDDHGGDDGHADAHNKPHDNHHTEKH